MQGGRALRGCSKAEPPPLARSSFPLCEALTPFRAPSQRGDVCSPPLRFCPSPSRNTRMCEYALFPRPHSGTLPPPVPALGAGCLPLKKSRTFLFTRSLTRKAGRIARPIVSKSSLKHSGDIHSWERERRPRTAHSSAPRSCFVHCFSFVPRCQWESERRAENSSLSKNRSYPS